MGETGYDDRLMQRAAVDGTERALEVIGERRLAIRTQGRMVARTPQSGRAVEVVRPVRSVQRVETFRKPGREFTKTGMVASLTTVVLTGMRVVRPLNPLHTVAGFLFVGFSIWHMLQNEKRARGG